MKEIHDHYWVSNDPKVIKGLIEMESTHCKHQITLQPQLPYCDNRSDARPSIYSEHVTPNGELVAGERGVDRSCLAGKRPEKGEKKSSPGKRWRKQKILRNEAKAEEEREKKSGSEVDRKGGSSAERNSKNQNKSCSIQDMDPAQMSLLEVVLENALWLAAPASDVFVKNKRTAWIQLAGHPDSFAPAGPGTVWKKMLSDSNESQVYEALMNESLRDMVPHYCRKVEHQGEKFIEIQDLLYEFTDPSVMDIKMGTRTFLESEVKHLTARADLYQKMIKLESTAPTEEEHLQKAVTKLRYMQFREEQSSSSSLGFRIEAIKLKGCDPVTDWKKVKSREDVMATIALYLGSRTDIQQMLLTRLKDMRKIFENSVYFQTHEIVGSSILIIYDQTKVGAWMIDFAKTIPVPDGRVLSHRTPWKYGNHEEGYLTGLDNLISITEDIDLAHWQKSCEPCSSLQTVSVESVQT